MPFDPQPELSGPTLVVRPMRADDFDALYDVARDPLLWEQHPAWDRYKPEVFEQLFADGLASGGALVVETHDGRVIGSSRFHGYDPERSEVEIGWTFLARDHWGGATNRELKRLMLEHAFRYVDRVLFIVGPDNHRSRRALEKIGARRMPGTVVRGGYDHVVFALDRSAFSL
jgi:N-acetyltransferase